MVITRPSYRNVATPLTREVILHLRAGEWISLSGEMYLARDATMFSIIEELERTGEAPFVLQGAVIFHAGPAPPLPGKTVGAVGPTTSARVDRFLEPLLERGVAATVGKGDRTLEGRKLHVRYGSLYLVACGGAAAYLTNFVAEMEVLAYPHLGPQALRRIIVESFPLLVGYDTVGGNIFQRKNPELRKYM